MIGSLAQEIHQSEGSRGLRTGTASIGEVFIPVTDPALTSSSTPLREDIGSQKTSRYEQEKSCADLSTKKESRHLFQNSDVQTDLSQ
jgi:hypothetical protein